MICLVFVFLSRWYGPVWADVCSQHRLEICVADAVISGGTSPDSTGRSGRVSQARHTYAIVFCLFQAQHAYDHDEPGTLWRSRRGWVESSTSSVASVSSVGAACIVCRSSKAKKRDLDGTE